MDFRSAYQSELEYLLEVGRSFSKVHAQASHLAERSGDPDVERLLEGFAFLTAKINARLDHAEPALAQSLSHYLAPQHLCPVPSCTMVEFRPGLESLQEAQTLAAGTQLASRPVNGNPLKFETTQPLTLLPLQLLDAQVASDGATRCCLSLELQTTEGGRAALGDVGHLDFFIHGEPSAASNLVFALAEYCKQVRIMDYAGAPDDSRPVRRAGARRILRSPKLELLGFSSEHPLLPWGELSPISHRLLAEFQTLPHKFRQVRVHGLRGLKLQDNRIRLEFELHCGSDLPGTVTADMIRLHTVPARNLFSTPAEPILLGSLDRPARIKAQGLQQTRFEVYDVQSVYRKSEGEHNHEAIPSFFDFPSAAPGSKRICYSLSRQNSPLDDHLDVFLRMHNAGPAAAASRDILSLDIRCTNRELANELRVGDINAASQENQKLASFSNITAPSRPCTPALDAETQWRLHATLAANRLSLADEAHLRALFSLYNDQSRSRTAQGAANDLMVQAIRAVSTRATTHVVNAAPVRGLASTVELDERNLGPGQSFLLGRLLDAIFAAHTCLNGVHATRIKLHPSGRYLVWKPRSGERLISP